jgi:hypothetical protein
MQAFLLKAKQKSKTFLYMELIFDNNASSRQDRQKGKASRYTTHPSGQHG